MGLIIKSLQTLSHLIITQPHQRGVSNNTNLQMEKPNQSFRRLSRLSDQDLLARKSQNPYLFLSYLITNAILLRDTVFYSKILYHLAIIKTTGVNTN